MVPATVPTDEQVEHLDKAVERAFAERDRLLEVWRRTGRDEDEQAMYRQDRHADRLLTQYNAACSAQYAESDRRRAENLARYEQEQIDRAMGRDGSGGHLDMPPPATPYTPAKRTPTKPAPTTTATSGASMTSADTYSSLRGRIQGIADRMPERQGLLQQVLAELDQDIAELNQINEDSNQAEIQEAIGLLMQAKDSVEQAIWMVGGAQASTEGAAAGLQ